MILDITLFDVVIQNPKIENFREVRYTDLQVRNKLEFSAFVQDTSYPLQEI